MMMKRLFYNIGIFTVLTIFIACTDNSNNNPGFEYMPDMYRSPSLETYGQNSTFPDSLNARKPVKGTISRGNLSSFNYDGSLEGYLLAGKNAKNPFDSDSDNIDEGKKLYAMFCTHCHGDIGDGKGSITHPVYSAVPSYSDNTTARRTGLPMSQLKAGHIFHAITYGLNAMGPHNTQINDTERWLITMYVQELQKGN